MPDFMSELSVAEHQLSHKRTLLNFLVLWIILYVVDIMTFIVSGMFFAISVYKIH